MDALGWLALSFLLYLLSFAIVIFLLFPLVRICLIKAFERLSPHSSARVVRQFVAVPIVGLLSRERRARRGDNRSLLQLFASQLVCTFIVSLIIQSFLASLLFTVIFGGWAYWALRA